MVFLNEFPVNKENDHYNFPPVHKTDAFLCNHRIKLSFSYINAPDFFTITLFVSLWICLTGQRARTFGKTWRAKPFTLGTYLHSQSDFAIQIWKKKKVQSSLSRKN